MSGPIDLDAERRRRKGNDEGWPCCQIWLFPGGKRRVWVSNDVIAQGNFGEIGARIDEAKEHVFELMHTGPGEAPVDDSLARAPENGPYSRLHLALIYLVTVARHAASTFKGHPRGKELADALARLDAARKT